MQNKKEVIAEILFLLLSFSAVFFGLWTIHTNHRIDDLEQTRMYRVYDAGGLTSTVGKVTGKTLTGNKYTLSIGGYGKFIVTHDVWQKAVVGGDMPEEVRQKVNELERPGG